VSAVPGARLLDDEPAFERLYHATARRLWSYLRRLTADAALAEDAVQESYVRLLRADTQGASDDERTALLYRIATNLVLDEWRRRRRQARLLARLPAAPPAAPEAGAAEDIGRLLETLAPRARALLWLAYVEGWTHVEIARALGLRPLSVRVLLFRARAALARRIREAGLEPEGGRHAVGS
jgi:RNA polymerase sigma-70 factor (ECF subfamily)